MTTISCFNSSTLLKDSEMFIMINAINTVLPRFCATWRTPLYRCAAAPKTIAPGSTGMYCIFLDTTDAPGAAAYHTASNNIALSKVFVKTIFTYNGATLRGATTSVPTVAQAFCHEIYEMIINPMLNIWWQRPNQSLVPAEVVDPVQGNVVPVTVGGVTVYLSDYLLPEWHNPQSKRGPYNFLNTLSRPFQVARGGYVIVLAAGKYSYVFGSLASAYIKHCACNMANVLIKSQKLENTVNTVV
jgi:hypothetical protein